MQPSTSPAATRALAALRWCAVAACGLMALPVPAQPAPPAAEMPRTFSGLCLAEAQAIVRAAFTEGRSATLQPVPAATAAALASTGIDRGLLNLQSLISPPSTFVLYQLPSPGAPRDASGCPLHETYLGYRQGGFVPQPLRFYGPLRATGPLSEAASSG